MAKAFKIDFVELEQQTLDDQTEIVMGFQITCDFPKENMQIQQTATDYEELWSVLRNFCTGKTKPKTETVEEYLKRGGTITKCKPLRQPPKPKIDKEYVNGLTLDDLLEDLEL